MERKIFKSHLIKADDEKRTLTHFVSVEKIDRDNEILLINGVQLENYKARPNAGIVLWLHGYDFTRGELPVGKNIDIAVADWVDPMGIKSNGLQVTTEFYDDEFSKTIFDMYKREFLTDWSVGFTSKKRTQREDGVGIFESWELLEYSAVAIGANPYAKAKALNLTEEHAKVWEKALEIEPTDVIINRLKQEVMRLIPDEKDIGQDNYLKIGIIIETILKGLDDLKMAHQKPSQNQEKTFLSSMADKIK